MVFVLGATSGAGHFQPEAHRLDVLGYLWLVSAALPLLVRRRYPLPVFVIVAALTWAYYWSHYPGGPAFVLPTIALFTLTRRRGPLAAGIAGGAILLAGCVVYLAAGGKVVLDVRLALFVVWVAAVVGIGTAVRNQVAAAQASRERAAEHEHRLAEQERLRIARDVHDVVAHSLAMINVQAGVAAHVADRRPEQAKEALLNIKEASASALKDLRATLAVLRSGEDRAPAPSLRQMSELLDHARATGLVVRVEGSPGELPAPTDGAAYRILQCRSPTWSGTPTSPDRSTSASTGGKASSNSSCVTTAREPPSPCWATGCAAWVNGPPRSAGGCGHSRSTEVSKCVPCYR
jgi:signal transduction histidine kinase